MVAAEAIRENANNSQFENVEISTTRIDITIRKAPIVGAFLIYLSAFAHFQICTFSN